MSTLTPFPLNNVVGVRHGPPPCTYRHNVFIMYGVFGRIPSGSRTHDTGLHRPPFNPYSVFTDTDLGPNPTHNLSRKSRGGGSPRRKKLPTAREGPGRDLDLSLEEVRKRVSWRENVRFGIKGGDFFPPEICPRWSIPTTPNSLGYVYVTNRELFIRGDAVDRLDTKPQTRTLQLHWKISGVKRVDTLPRFLS